MYPVAGYILARVFDKDLDVLGYHIPSGVNIIMHEHLVSLDERYHGSDAKKFVPERWLRDETGRMKEVNSFTSLPFGYGVRSCLGRRMAEVIMYTLVSKIVLSYRLESGRESRVNPGLRAALMKPNRAVSLKFIPRE
jgi:cytochrome P450